MGDPDRFTVLPEHLKLLRAAYVRWEDIETGAPAIDGKRPYGNSDVPGDVVEILGWEGDPSEDNDLRERALAIHKETETALQIVLATGAFYPGEYVTPRYQRDWRLAEPDLGLVTLTFPAGPAFADNAIMLLDTLAGERPNGPGKEVLERLATAFRQQYKGTA